MNTLSWPNSVLICNGYFCGQCAFYKLWSLSVCMQADVCECTLCVVCVCCVCEGERYFQKVNLLEVIVFPAARLFTFCGWVCAHMCMR